MNSNHNARYEFAATWNVWALMRGAPPPALDYGVTEYEMVRMHDNIRSRLESYRYFFQLTDSFDSTYLRIMLAVEIVRWAKKSVDQKPTTRSGTSESKSRPSLVEKVGSRSKTEMVAARFELARTCAHWESRNLNPTP